MASAVSVAGAGPVNTISSGVLPVVNGVVPTTMSADACSVSRFSELSLRNALAQMFVIVVSLSLPPSESPSMFARYESPVVLMSRIDGSSRSPDAGAFHEPP